MIKKEYAAYKGDKFLCLGTVKEIAKFLNVKETTVRWYASSSYYKRIKQTQGKKKYSEAIIIIRIEEELGSEV